MRIVHVSDLHLQEDSTLNFYDEYPQQHMKKAVDIAAGLEPAADAVVLGGDVFHDGTGDYGVVEKQFSIGAAPVYTALGNHDQLFSFRNTTTLDFPSTFTGYYSFVIQNISLIILNSATTGGEEGLLDEPQLSWLSVQLQEASENSQVEGVVLFMHHSPLHFGYPDWIDAIGLINKEAFWKLLHRFSGIVKGVFAAHAHMQITTMYENVLVATPPALCRQFSWKATAGKGDPSGEDPGFNVIDVGEKKVSIRTVRFPGSFRRGTVQ